MGFLGGITFTVMIIAMLAIQRNQEIAQVTITVWAARDSWHKLTVNSELSYLHQYVEQNGRSHGDPWSLRQTGIYQQVNAEHRRSVWIFLQLSRSTRRQLEPVLHSQSNSSDSFMILHSILLLATVDNWGKYVEHLHSQLRDLVC